MSDRMPQPRRSSRGRHRAPVASTRPRLSTSLRPGRIAQGALALGLVLSLGGYTFAESTTQHVSAAAHQSAVDAAERTREQVAGERERAVATAQTAVVDATAVQTVAAGSVADDVLAPLTKAVASLTTLIEAVPATTAAVAPRSAETAGSLDAADLAGAEHASRGVTREPVPTGEGVVAPGSSSPDLLSAFAASDSARDEAQAADPAATPAPTAAAAAEPAAGTDAPSSGPSPTASPDPSPTASGATAPADDVAPDDAVAARILAAAARVADLTADVKSAAQASVAAAQAEAATAAQAEQAAAAAKEKAAQRASLAAYANGRVPADALCAITFAPGQQLRCDAAEALSRLNTSFTATFGSDLTVTDSYRSYAAQVSCARTKGHLCARPGTSNHGRGVAVDLGSGVEGFGTTEHRWMAAHAAEFGWALPDWASRTGSKSEPWHWEFMG